MVGKSYSVHVKESVYSQGEQCGVYATKPEKVIVYSYGLQACSPLGVKKTTCSSDERGSL